MTQMIEVKTAELEGKALDWAVAMSEGATNLYFGTVACWWFTLNGADRVLSSGWSEKQNYCPSTDWRYGGQLIEKNGIEVFCNLSAEQASRFKDSSPDWRACMNRGRSEHSYGPTPLIAAMRCLVAAKLGEVVTMPKEMLS
jgi:hypothetical protein